MTRPEAMAEIKTLINRPLLTGDADRLELLCKLTGFKVTWQHVSLQPYGEAIDLPERKPL